MGSAEILELKNFPDSVCLKLQTGGVWRSDEIDSSVVVNTVQPSTIDLILKIDGDPAIRFENDRQETTVDSKEINGEGELKFSWKLKEVGQADLESPVIIVVFTQDTNDRSKERRVTHPLVIEKEEPDEANA